MMKQLIFREKYVQLLKERLSHEEYLKHYSSKDFIYDKRQVLTLPNIDTTTDLLSKLDANDDYKTAISIYEAYKNLAPIQASDERIWVYLAHVDLYPYMIERRPEVFKGSSSNPSKYILDHWFLSSTSQSSLLRHKLPRLSWAVFLSIDETRGENKYNLTKILFRQIDFATRTLGTYKLGRHKEAVLGILEFIEENGDLFKRKFEDKTRFITKYLNFIGGLKPLSYYDRYFFKSELEKIREKISSIGTI